MISRQEIGAVEDAQTCQKFCNELYPTTCTWFMLDRTTSDCKLFKGALTDLNDDCRERGYSVTPDHTECDVVFEAESDDACSVSKTI